MSQELQVVGKRIPPPDRAEKATGTAQFTVDTKLPGMLIGKVLRSPHAHARITRVDTSQAEKLPGVEAVLTREDVPRKLFNQSCIGLALRSPRAMGEQQDQYILDDRVRFVGDGVAAVAAVDENTAEKALALIDVEYEPLPAVFDPLEAMKPGAPRIHDSAENNVAWHAVYPFAAGDVDRGFQEADCVVEDTFYTSKQKHGQIELDACLASFDVNGRLTVWSPCQHPHLARRTIAELFDMPEGMIRWQTPYLGGSFGGRINLNAEPICIALAKKAGKPVKLEYTREEDFIVHESRQPYIYRLKMGFKQDGTITAIQARLTANAGAYFTHSGSVTGVSLISLMALYRCPNKAGEADIVYTNSPISGGMRGYGSSQANFAMEQLLDVAAEKLGMDPAELRLKNFKVVGEPGWLPIYPMQSCAVDECVRIGAERIGWREKREKEGVRRRGVGMACVTGSSGTAGAALEHSNAFIKLNEDGSASLVVSPVENGAGILGVLAQIAAEELGVRAEDVHVVRAGTDITQFDIGTHANRSTYVIGNAVLRAAREARGQLLERASKTLKVPIEELEVKDRRVYVKESPENGISVAEVVRGAIYNFRRESLHISGRCSFESGPVISPTHLATFVEVEVDTETGEVKVLRMVNVADIGQAINPMNVEGQIEGGAIQGLGWALTEDFVFDDKTGETITKGFKTYKLPSMLDIPRMEVILVEHPDPAGPFGAKGIGETAIIPPAAAIANAIYDAVGVRIKELPISPEKVLRALKEKGGA
jgi:xanthine dehydrogenase molybdenum-binding subunit